MQAWERWFVCAVQPSTPQRLSPATWPHCQPYRPLSDSTLLIARLHFVELHEQIGSKRPCFKAMLDVYIANMWRAGGAAPWFSRHVAAQSFGLGSPPRQAVLRSGLLRPRLTPKVNRVFDRLLVPASLPEGQRAASARPRPQKVGDRESRPRGSGRNSPRSGLAANQLPCGPPPIARARVL